MLSKLYNYGITNKYFEEKKICQFSKAQREGISTIQTEAIEFDETTKKISSELSCVRYSSCDALKFLITKNRFDFIEFKQVKIRSKEDLKILMEGFNLDFKIKDSFFILKCIRQKANLSNAEKRDYDLVEKNVYFYMNPIDDPNLSFTFDQFWVIVRESIVTILENIENIEQNFNTPEIKKLSELDSHY